MVLSPAALHPLSTRALYCDTLRGSAGCSLPGATDEGFSSLAQGTSAAWHGRKTNHLVVEKVNRARACHRCVCDWSGRGSPRTSSSVLDGPMLRAVGRVAVGS